jgi:hypothetical protein
MNTPSVARAAIVLPLRKRRKVVRPASRRKLVLALLLALGAGIGINFATRPRLSGNASLPPLENNAALEGWSDSAGRAALRERRLERIASGCATASRQRREAVLDSFPAWRDDVLRLVACRRIRPGFTSNQLRAAWGEPERIIPDLNSQRPMEQWDYGTRSVLIWDNVIKSWQ